MEASIPEQPQATGVGSHISADVARALGAEVERDDMVMGDEEVGEGLQDAARVRDEDTCTQNRSKSPARGSSTRLRTHPTRRQSS